MALYEFRVRRFRARIDDEDDGELENGPWASQRLRREGLDAERREIVRLRGEARSTTRSCTGSRASSISRTPG
ncbi:MAG: hypothetical protein ACR2NB_07630 [Solirubrobacteraceae bacterium]